jgi:hypothetical protein
MNVSPALLVDQRQVRDISAEERACPAHDRTQRRIGVTQCREITCGVVERGELEFTAVQHFQPRSQFLSLVLEHVYILRAARRRGNY